MLMFDDGTYTLGIYGFKDGYVYVMDPHDKSRVFCNSKTEFEPTVSRCARGSFANYAGTYIILYCIDFMVRGI